MSDLPDYALLNREHWTQNNAAYTDARAPREWASERITWGMWSIPEDEVRALPDYRGKDVVELGCGTAYFSAWLKMRGARRVVGVDVTPAQLETARRMDSEFKLGLELLEANAEQVPLPDAQFDLALSEYGASIWCDPEKWIPEAARLLRPGGELVFLRNSTLSNLCFPPTGRVVESLQRPQNGMKRLEWLEDDVPCVEFHLPVGEMFRLLGRAGFEVLDIQELYAPESAVDHVFYIHITAEWARKWPAEEIWRARKRG